MKKIFMFLIGGLAVIGTANALNICIKKGSYVGVLKKSINGTNIVSDATKKIWGATYDYTSVNGNSAKKITGIAACNDVAGTVGVATTNLKTYATDEGANCWCMMWPVSDYGTYTGITSWWVLHSVMADDATCAADCAAACGNSVANNTNGFRDAIFDAVK